MEMTTVSIRQRLEKIKDLEKHVKYCESQMKFYQGLAKSSEELNNEDYEFVRDRATRYIREFNQACDRLRDAKIELNSVCNMEAMSYDSPCIVGDRYYENQFKTNGYLIGIRL